GRSSRRWRSLQLSPTGRCQLSRAAWTRDYGHAYASRGGLGGSSLATRTDLGGPLLSARLARAPRQRGRDRRQRRRFLWTLWSGQVYAGRLADRGWRPIGER